MTNLLTPNTRLPQDLPGWKRTFEENRLTLGVFIPIEAFPDDAPSMQNQVELVQLAEAGGFASAFVRDVPVRDPSFGDVGQIFDPWVYLGYLAGQTSTIALGTGAIVLPLHHPLDLAKQAASVDQLSGGRLLLGVASGDRPVEFPAYGQDHATRGETFRENLAVMQHVWSTQFIGVQWSRGLLQGADLVPKSSAVRPPILITGSSQQSPEWIAQNADGWITYPRPLTRQHGVIQAWHTSVASADAGFKPFAQSLFIDLLDNPDAAPQSMHQGFRLGRNRLIDILSDLQRLGGNHVVFNLKYGRKSAREQLEELITYVVPEFPAL